MNVARFSSRAMTMLSIALLVCLSPLLSASEQLEPSALVSDLFEEMNSRLQSDKEMIAADRTHLLSLGDEVLGPYVSFDKMAKQVLGKHWKKITKDQQQRYTKAFRDRVSVAMVSQYDPNRKYGLNVTGERRNKKGNRAVVKSVVKELSGVSTYLIDYKLFLNKKTDNWQVYDVVVEGISVLQSFKSASADEIKKNGIEKLIEQLQVAPSTKGDNNLEEVPSEADPTKVAVKANSPSSSSLRATVEQ